MLHALIGLLLDLAFGRREGPAVYVSPTTGRRHW